MRENFTNFATTQLVSPTTLSPGALSFTVTRGTGALFPQTNFAVNVDTEMMNIVSRSGDTFVVAPLGRGFDGTLAAQHLAGSTVQLSICAYNLLHLWQNVPDGYKPDVPFSQLLPGASVMQPTSPYDNEFESVGNWTLYPNRPPGGTTFSVGTPLTSHLLLDRGPSDNGLYTAYISLGNYQGPLTITAKISEGVNVPKNGTSEVAETHLFVSDQPNPISSGDSGNRFRVDTRFATATTSITQNNTTGSVLTSTDRQVRCSRDQNGTWSQLNPVAPIPIGVPIYLRVMYDGQGNWTGLFGDGYTYTLLVYLQNFTFTPATMGLQFYAAPLTGFSVAQTVAVDYVRFATTQLGPYGG